MKPIKIKPPFYVGYWRVSEELYIGVEKRPSRWTRFWLWLSHGWTYEHEEK